MKSKDSVSTISLGESQGGAYASPEQNSSNIYASPRGKTERFAMRSSFAIGVSTRNWTLYLPLKLY